jgi:Tfp pilus assembly protein PilF
MRRFLERMRAGATRRSVGWLPLLALLAGCAGAVQPRAGSSDASAAGPDALPPRGAPAAASASHDGVPKPETGSTVGPATKPGTVAGGLARGNGTAADRALLAGDRALDADDLDGARRAYLQALELGPDDPAARVGLVRVAVAETGIETTYAAAPDHPKLKELRRELETIRQLDAEYGPVHLELGRVLLILGQAAPARDSLRHAARLLPGDAEAHSALGVALLATGDKPAALTQLRRASELDPENADRLANLGAAYLSLGQVSDAIRAYSRAIARDPSDARINGDLGTAYLAGNEPHRAMPYLQKAVELAPGRATFLSNLGYAHQAVGKYDEAAATYRRALALDDRLVEAWINLGTVYAKQRHYREARRALERALTLSPDDPRAKANLAELDQLTRGRQP